MHSHWSALNALRAMYVDLLSQHHDLPGIIWSQPLQQTRVTSKGTEIYKEEEIGASMSIPRDSVDSDVDIGLGTAFAGSQRVPDDMEPVSPPYVVTANKEVVFRKDATLRMQYTTNLNDSKDEMVLMEAEGNDAGGPASVLKRSAKKVQTGLDKVRFGVVKLTKLACTTVYRLVKPKRKHWDKLEGT